MCVLKRDGWLRGASWLEGVKMKHESDAFLSDVVLGFDFIDNIGLF